MYKNNADFSSLFPYFLLFFKCDFLEDYVFIKSFDSHDDLIKYACHNAPSKTYIREIKFYTTDFVTYADVTIYYKKDKSSFFKVAKE